MIKQIETSSQDIAEFSKLKGDPDLIGSPKLLPD